MTAPAVTSLGIFRPLVDGSEVDMADTFTLACPATGDPVAVVQAADGDVVDQAVRAAKRSFEAGDWSGRAPRERARILHRVAARFEERIDEFARIDALCTGRPLRELRPQVGRLPEWFRYFAGIVEGLEGTVPPFAGPYLNYTHRVPIGVVAQVVTWNHPLLLLVKKLAPALAAGNSIVVKPSELTPLTTLELPTLCHEAGLPAGALHVVPGLAPAGVALVSHPDVDRIDFTGGTETGRAIARAAAENLVPSTLELGGKAPLLIFEDVSLERAVAGSLFAAFIATGQTCVSGARVLVHNSLYERFLGRLRERAEVLRLGHPLDPATEVGPLVSEAQLERVLGYIELGRDEGARLVTGGSRASLEPPLDRGHFLQPTIFADVRPEMRIAREEIFGPVVCVSPFSTEEEAVRLANESDFGLGASVWTGSLTRAHRVAEALRNGIVWINDHHRNDPSSPWGGFKASGYGRENGWESLLAYTAVKSIVVNLSDDEFDWFAPDSGPKRYG